jgi:XTP/dITP diphosphohydrolase
MEKLLLGTTRQGKIAEFKALLQGIPFHIVTPVELGLKLDVEETGATYAENARIKAQAFAEASGLLTLADDSGLDIDALSGEPGIRSSRYAGEGASDQDRIDLVLSRLAGVPREKRTAHFRCVIALAGTSQLAGTDQWLEYCFGECHGIITFEPKGDKGFGYDPIFYFPDLGKTMAELPEDIKNTISHRGRATQEARKKLLALSPGG